MRLLSEERSNRHEVRQVALHSLTLQSGPRLAEPAELGSDSDRSESLTAGRIHSEFNPSQIGGCHALILRTGGAMSKQARYEGSGNESPV